MPQDKWIFLLLVPTRAEATDQWLFLEFGRLFLNSCIIHEVYVINCGKLQYSEASVGNYSGCAIGTKTPSTMSHSF